MLEAGVLRLNVAMAFVPLSKPSRYKGLYGGRGGGKSQWFAESVVRRACQGPGLRVVCVREVQRSLRESVKRLLEDKIAAMGVGGSFGVFDDRIVTPGGGVIYFQGMQDHTAESIKSLEGFDVAWAEEAQTLSARSLEFLRPTIRRPKSELWFSWNPRVAKDPVDKFFRGGEVPPDTILRKVNYLENPFFPAELEAERAYDEVHKRDRYGHIWLGEYEPAAVGAIWDRVMIHEGRRTEVPRLTRIVVAVDPAVSSEEGSDDHGIVVAGIGEDGRGYVLDDATVRGGPRQWADRTVRVFDKWEADAIVIEVNQGGDMCRNTLATIRPGLPVKEVRATRGKHVRAEPIAALYAEGKVSHVGTFPELEDQLCAMTSRGYEGDGSPDRCDALIWALSELFAKLVKPRAREWRELPTRANNVYNPHRLYG